MRLAVLAAAVLAAAGLGAAYAAGALGGDSHPHLAQGTPPPRPDATELAAIRRLVLTEASKKGDPSPTGGVVVPTTRRLVELVDVDTAEADIPVYFVLVHGEFTNGTLLTLTIDPQTNESIGTGLTGSTPDLDAIGKPEPLPLVGEESPLTAELELTKNVPCPNGTERRVGPDALRRFQAVTAVSCVDSERTYPGRGQWEVQVRRVAVGSVAGLQKYFEQPSESNLPKNGACLANLIVILVPVFVDAQGHRLVPRTPVDGCGHPLGYPYGRPAPVVRWHVLSVRNVRLLVSAAALAAHCAMEIKDLTADAIGPLDPTSGGRLFASTPKTMHVCIYRTPPNDFEVGRFVRGFALNAAQTSRLLGALTGAAPTGSCPAERTFAVVSAKPERWAEVELGGCWRVGGTYPDYGLGSADASVVSAILGAR